MDRSLKRLLIGVGVVALLSSAVAAVPYVKNSLSDDQKISCASIASGKRGVTYVFAGVSSDEAEALDRSILSQSMANPSTMALTYDFSNRTYTLGINSPNSRNDLNDYVIGCIGNSGLAEDSRLLTLMVDPSVF